MRIHQAPFFFQPNGFVPLQGQRAYEDLFIDGAWVAPVSSQTYDVFNPATGARIGKAPEGNAQDCDRAIAAARRAFDQGPWPRLSMRERYAYLRRFMDVLRARQGDLAGLTCAESGAPIPLANGMHIAMALDQMDAALEMALRLRPRMLEPTVTQLPDALGGQKMVGNYLVTYEPVGVASLLGAYNFPFLLTGIKIIPALIAGNTAVVKAPPQTPLQTLAFAEAAEAAKLPAGVLNFLTGTGVEIGETLTQDPRVDLVSFTGSDAVGAKIMAQASTTIKRVFLELGGKSALIVRADGDLDLAAAVGFASVSIQAGQGCILTTRHLVHESVLETYLEKVSAMAANAVLGDPADPATTIGPLISAAQCERTEQFVNQALAQGGQIVFGGKRPAHLPNGHFFEPTLIRSVDNKWPIAQQEIFGPVAVVIPFSDDAEAIRMANDSVYGLSGHIVSRDVGRALDMAAQIRTGEVYINGGAGAMSPFQPFGGTKRSGFGKQGGEEGLLEYMNLKTVLFKGA